MYFADEIALVFSVLQQFEGPLSFGHGKSMGYQFIDLLLNPWISECL